MNELFNDMLNKGLVSTTHFQRLKDFENFPYINEAQLESWFYFDGNLVKKDQCIFQHAILPCMIKEWSRN